MLKALHYCHKVVGVVHKDIKPDNIVVGHSREAILIDFGLAAQYGHTDEEQKILKIKAGTYKFFAPELLDVSDEVDLGKEYTFGPATDMWALGLTFFQLLTGRYPFEGASSFYDLKDMIMKRGINFELVKDKTARHCIERMLDKNPDTRATVDELLETDWVTNSGVEKVEVNLVDRAGTSTIDNV